MIPFDKAGRCTGPRTREHLVGAVKNGDFTDVYLFSHGWNNAWAEASARYEHFIKGYSGVRHDRRLDRPCRPLLVGVFWPSAILVLPGERAPVFSLSPDAPAEDGIVVAQERREVAEIAEALPDDVVERFYDLAQVERDLTEAETRELAEMLAPLYTTAHEELPLAPDPPDPEELIAMWAGLGAADLETVPSSRRRPLPWMSRGRSASSDRRRATRSAPPRG